MPVLAANQVTLAEVLEVKGSPLNEEEIWAVLSQAGKAIEQVLAEGKSKLCFLGNKVAWLISMK